MRKMRKLLIYHYPYTTNSTFKYALEYVREYNFPEFRKIKNLKCYIQENPKEVLDLIFLAHGEENDVTTDEVEVCFTDCKSTIHELISELDVFSNIRSILFLSCFTRKVNINFENINQVISYKGHIKSDVLPIIVAKYHELILNESDLKKGYNNFIYSLLDEIQISWFDRDVPT